MFRLLSDYINPGPFPTMSQKIERTLNHLTVALVLLTALLHPGKAHAQAVGGSDITSIALLITIVLFEIGVFIPLMITPKWSSFRSAIRIICISLAVLLLPSVYYDWGTGQNLIILAWVLALVLAIVSALGKKPEPQSIQAGNASATNDLDQLERLSKLKADGALTPEEFEAEKSKILLKKHST